MGFYTYQATIILWVDGDTVDVDIDLGFGIRRMDRVRLFGANCPEATGTTRDAGLAAKLFASELAPTGTLVALRSSKPKDKYGRYLATIVLDDGRSVADEIIKAGHGVPYDGGKR